MYVDGLLAENHGLGPDAFDPLLAEAQGTADTPYAPAALLARPRPAAGDRHASSPTSTCGSARSPTSRHRTWSSRPSASTPPHAGRPPGRCGCTPLGGAAVTCATPDADIPGWPAVIAPSGARLTVDTIAVDDDDDPCALPPTGGYRGLENQTYRVEVHTGGAPGHGDLQVVARQRLGRHAGASRCCRGHGDPAGVVRPRRRARASRPATGSRSSTTTASSTGCPARCARSRCTRRTAPCASPRRCPPTCSRPTAQAAARHLRVRRWDQTGQVKSGAGGNLDDLDAPGSPGVITVPAAAQRPRSCSSTASSCRSPSPGAGASAPATTGSSPRGPPTPRSRISTRRRRSASTTTTRGSACVTFPDGETDCRTLWPPECECEGGEAAAATARSASPRSRTPAAR